jgi:predicted metallo-beta-lactamase superfamily hydrolase
MRGDAYEGVFDSMQSAIDAAQASNKEETVKELRQVHSDFLRLEIVIDDKGDRTKLWARYDELKKLCSEAQKDSARSSASVLPEFDNLQEAVHAELYKRLFTRTPDEERAYQRLMQADSLN